MYISLFLWPSICLCFCLVHPLPFSSPWCYPGECGNPLWDSHRARVDQSQQHQDLHTEIIRWIRNPHHWIRWEQSDTQSVISLCWNWILIHSLHGVWGSEKHRIYLLSSYRYVSFFDCEISRKLLFFSATLENLCQLAHNKWHCLMYI